MLSFHQARKLSVRHKKREQFKAEGETKPKTGGAASDWTWLNKKDVRKFQVYYLLVHGLAQLVLFAFGLFCCL